MWLLSKILIFLLTLLALTSSKSTLCSTLRIEPGEVCEGITKLFEPQVVYVFGHTNLSNAQMCDQFVLGCVPDVEPKWTIAVPEPKPKAVQMPSVPANATTLKALYLSDMHFDKDYMPGSLAECDKKLCCRGTSDNIAKDKAAGFWGDYRNCDAPLHLVRNAFEHIQKTHPDIDYIIWTGDLTPHNVWNQTRQEHLDYIDMQTDLFNTYFPGIPVYPATGNHETVPVNEFSFPDTVTEFNMKWLYEAFADSWIKTGLPEETRTNITRGSFYTAIIKPGFRVVSLNMNYCNNYNIWLFERDEDPLGQLKWLVKVLEDSEKIGEAVHILGHIAPGSSSCTKEFSWAYWKIVNRFESTIRGQFFGHTHLDKFELFYDNNDLSFWTMPRPTSVAYLGPSLTPFSQLNPGYRVFTIDGRKASDEGTFTVLNHETHILNLTEANESNKTNWFKEYDAKNFFGMENLQPASWAQVVNRLQSNDTLFAQYYQFRYKMHARKKCDDKQCRLNILCDLLTSRSRDPKLCEHLGQLDHWQQLAFSINERNC